MAEDDQCQVDINFTVFSWLLNTGRPSALGLCSINPTRGRKLPLNLWDLGSPNDRNLGCVNFISAVAFLFSVAPVISECCFCCFRYWIYSFLPEFSCFFVCLEIGCITLTIGLVFIL
jgi:hypothetical protein